ncbi:ABC transporter permease [candidate division KSB1 bacterium]|nr:ABC transporter permease [candidate division KSB1 bacterium]
MIKFLIKGLLRDRSKSLFPVLTVTAGVTLVVFAICWVGGVQTNMMSASAHFRTGHVKIMTRAYAEQSDLLPVDLALVGTDSLLGHLKASYPGMIWTQRILFAGLLDVPDESGETREQGTVAGIAISVLDPGSPEHKFLEMEKSIVRGRMPQKSYDCLISETFAQKLKVNPGDEVTLIGSTMFGAMSMTNFTVAGTVRFGISALDRGALIADITDVQTALDMDNGASEILGFFTDDIYHREKAVDLAEQFNIKNTDPDGEFSPVMLALEQQEGLAGMLDMVGMMSSVIITIFIVVMSIVLWNAGLMGNIRRYGEIGVRLAMGEAKGHLYRSLLLEAFAIGIFGSLIGTVLGLIVSFYLQYHGIDITSFLKDSTIMLPDVMRARVTSSAYFIGFLPGVCATFLGAAISGIGVYKRQTSQLFKELEV